MVARNLLLWAAVVLGFIIASSKTQAHEGTEWETAYWYNANDSSLPRILLIGDSIVKGYEGVTRNNLAGMAYVSFYATSKSVDDPSYLVELSAILDEFNYNYKVIQFNNGLHSLSADRTKWEAGLRAALKLIQEKDKGAKIIWATSTPLKDPALTLKAKELNAIADKVMRENNIPTDDLFALMDPLDRSVYWVDTYHYNGAAIEMQAKQVSEKIRQLLGVKKATAADAAAALASAASDTGPDGKITINAASPPTGTAAPDENQGTPADPALNIIKNPGFETDEAWHISPPENGTLEFSRENPHSGQYAAKITVNAGGLQLFQDTPFFIPGVKYKIKYWARSQEPLTMAVYIRTTQPPYLYYGDQNPFALTTEWQEYSSEIAFPADYNPSACKLFFIFSSTGTYWLDDISVEKEH